MRFSSEQREQGEKSVIRCLLGSGVSPPDVHCTLSLRSFYRGIVIQNSLGNSRCVKIQLWNLWSAEAYHNPMLRGCVHEVSGMCTLFPPSDDWSSRDQSPMQKTVFYKPRQERLQSRVVAVFNICYRVFDTVRTEANRRYYRYRTLR